MTGEAFPATLGTWTCSVSNPIFRKPNLYVLSIGVSKYPNLSPNLQLDYADKDAARIAEAFKNQGGDIFGRVQECVLTNAEATVEKITDALDDFRH